MSYESVTHDYNDNVDIDTYLPSFRNIPLKSVQQNISQHSKNIVTCTGVRVTNNNGSRSDDWIY
jgi:hypothetical protein